MKSGNLNFLEPSGPLRACNGTALPFFTLSRKSCCVLAVADSQFLLLLAGGMEPNGAQCALNTMPRPRITNLYVQRVRHAVQLHTVLQDRRTYEDTEVGAKRRPEMSRRIPHTANEEFLRMSFSRVSRPAELYCAMYSALSTAGVLTCFVMCG